MENLPVLLSIFVGASGIFCITSILLYLKLSKLKIKIDKSNSELSYQKQLMFAIINSRENEQSKIAHRLHDNIGSSLTAIKMSLIQMDLNDLDRKTLNEGLKNVSTDIRRISNDLMPSILEILGLRKAIIELVQRMNEQSDITFTYAPCCQSDLQLAKVQEVAIYRILQEIIKNSLNYSGASKIDIRDEKKNNRYSLKVKDDGYGFSPTDRDLKNKSSLGLKNIIARIQQLDAHINYEILPDQGTLITIDLKL